MQIRVYSYIRHLTQRICGPASHRLAGSLKNVYTHTYIHMYIHHRRKRRGVVLHSQ